MKRLSLLLASLGLLLSGPSVFAQDYQDYWDSGFWDNAGYYDDGNFADDWYYDYYDSDYSEGWFEDNEVGYGEEEQEDDEWF